jgi:general secretion pathway protein N
MNPAPRFLLAFAALFVQTSDGAERDRVSRTAALENAPALGAPDTAPELPRPEAGPTPIPEPSATQGNPLWSIPLRALSATRERPLFSPSRRPPAPVIAEAPTPAAPTIPIVSKPAEPENPPLVLMGTVVSSEKRVAIVFNRTTRQVIRVREGAEEQGWRVRLVSPRSAVVEKDDRSVTLDLPNPGDEAAKGGMPARGGMPAISAEPQL